jgi:hypothetical protein
VEVPLTAVVTAATAVAAAAAAGVSNHALHVKSWRLDNPTLCQQRCPKRHPKNVIGCLPPCCEHADAC